MKRILATLVLLLAPSIYVPAQKQRGWGSARERGLRGVVHTVVSMCSDTNGKNETRFRYEFSRDGKMAVVTAPQFSQYVCINYFPFSQKITKRNGRGDVEEISIFIKDDVAEKERYEYEYDDSGNWIKQVRSVMRTYEMEGGDWKAGEWQAKYVCRRKIEYYPDITVKREGAK